MAAAGEPRYVRPMVDYGRDRRGHMTVRTLIVRVLWAVCALVLLGVAVVCALFIHDRNAILAKRQLLSTLVATSRGPIEYAEIGRGRPVLYMHATPGGYDQMLLVLRAEYGDVGPPFRAIVPSRPGYLRTPID